MYLCVCLYVCGGVLCAYIYTHTFCPLPKQLLESDYVVNFRDSLLLIWYLSESEQSNFSNSVPSILFTYLCF